MSTTTSTLTYIPPVVVAGHALVCPPLSYDGQLLVPDEFLHVARGRLGPVGLLPPGHFPPELVVFVHQTLLGRLSQISLHSLGSAGIRGALVQAHRVAAVYGAVLSLGTNTSTSTSTTSNIS